MLPGAHSSPSGRIVLDLCPGRVHCPAPLSVWCTHNGRNAAPELVPLWRNMWMHYRSTPARSTPPQSTLLGLLPDGVVYNIRFTSFG